jgi:hypothetical protein
VIEKVDFYTFMGEFNGLDAGYGYLGDYIIRDIWLYPK